jgi:hypothetical protein
MPEDIFDDISKKLAKYQERGSLLLMGDLNARTQSLSDFIPDIDVDHSGISDSNRNSLDQASPTVYGRRFIDMCRETPLRILNGRYIGDFMGNFTCIRPQGMSVVDYAAASPDLLQDIKHFSVHHYVPTLSDHCPISLTLRVRARVTEEEVQRHLSPRPDKVVWVRNMTDSYCNIIQSVETRSILTDFLAVGILPDQSSVDSAAALLTSMMVTAAKQAGMRIRKGAVPRRQARHDLGFSKPRVKHPRWFDMSCHQAYSAVKATAALLSKEPRNAWLRGKLCKESKDYNRVVRQNQKSFVDGLFKDLEAMDRTDPKGYMDLIKSMKQGRFDKQMPSDTSSVSSDVWFTHFKELLGKSLSVTPEEEDMELYISQNIDLLQTELDRPFSREELRNVIKCLKNNKATSFDQVCNEMLKSCGPVMESAMLLLFNTCFGHSLFVSEWKKDLLGPLYKSGIKSDPCNFRGICISSCQGRLLTSMLRFRLETKCTAEGLIRPEQASSQKGARTSDHLLVLHHLIQKYVKNENKLLYICYIDLKQAYDRCGRIRLFYELLYEYRIGGKFLRILNNIYTNNEMYIKLDEGITRSFNTTIGCKQGCNLSGILFNLFIGKLPSVFDDECDGVQLDGRKLNCLLWADDCILMSLSSKGLQRSIDLTVKFFNDRGQTVNVKKTQCMIMNKRGRKAKEFSHLRFTANGRRLVLADEYVYLGITFIPSGASHAAMSALHDKASRAYFSIANILYCNRRMPVQRALRLADSLVFPVSSYASEYITPLVLPTKSFFSQEELLRAWEGYKPELVNQRLCRLLLSVHKKASRLAVLGELGRYPRLVTSLASTVSYSQQLSTRPHSTLVRRAYNEMQSMVTAGEECWLGKVMSIKQLLGIPDTTQHGVRAKSVLKQIKSKFDTFYLREINNENIGLDGLNHNKLRFYSTLKGCFKPEYYVNNIHNRGQRAELCRVRTSAHRLGVELGRRTVPPTPLHRRTCGYCPITDDPNNPSNIDDEIHLFQCPTFINQQRCLFSMLGRVVPNFEHLSFEHKVRTMLCPVSTQAAKLVNKYVRIIFNSRSKLDDGHPLSTLTFPPMISSLESTDSVSESSEDSESDTESDSSFDSCEL